MRSVIEHNLAMHHRRLRAQIVAAARAAGGGLPFDHFMELALYAPELGYYTGSATKFGAAGDFVTAPEISPLFGLCLARQCAEVLTALDGGDILEFGAGSGALALAILQGLKQLGRLPERYLIVEVSPELRARQQAVLEPHLPQLGTRVEWRETLPGSLRGVLLANEVLDAMPVQRFSIGSAGRINEVLVVPDDTAPSGLAEKIAAPVSPGLVAAVAQLQAEGLATAPGFCSEINLRLLPWMRAVANSLEQGLLLIVDYGYPRREYYAPTRCRGTLMCYFRHTAHEDPYCHLGQQDISAHVDFSAVAAAGTAAGFTLAGYTTQAHFLLGCGIDEIWSDRATAAGTLMHLAAGVKQLLLPAAMGERFRVLGLNRRLEQAWCGFSMRDLRGRL